MGGVLTLLEVEIMEGSLKGVTPPRPVGKGKSVEIGEFISGAGNSMGEGLDVRECTPHLRNQKFIGVD